MIGKNLCCFSLFYKVWYCARGQRALWYETKHFTEVSFANFK